MIVRTIADLEQLGMIVQCPKGNFESHRYVLKNDNMGYTVTKTVIPAGTDAIWHYKNHLESCYCVSGLATVTDLSTGVMYTVEPDTLYAMDKHEEHRFQAVLDTVLICVFNPPLNGKEVHKGDNSYE